MYRTNKCGCSIGNRIDPRILMHIEDERFEENGRQQVCGCNNTSCDIEEKYNNEFDFSLAMVYSPYQEFQNIYPLEEGFEIGTVFKELNKPFYGSKCNGGVCHE